MSLIRVLKKRWVAPAVLALTSASTALAQTPITVFHDDFSGGSTVNSNPTSPAAPSLNAAAYQIIAGKAYAADPVIVAPTGTNAGKLQFGLNNATPSNAFIEAQAIFTPHAVKLDALNDYVEMTVTFTAESSLLDDSNSGIFFGLFNSSSEVPSPATALHDPVVSQPRPNGQQSTAFEAGYAGYWRGHVIRMFGSGGQFRFYGRPAVTSGTSFNQEVLGTNGSQFATGNSSITSLSAGTQYTAVVRFTKYNTLEAPRIRGNVALYLGNSADGAPIPNTELQQNATSSGNILTMVYDAVAIGLRTSSGVAADSKSVAINSIKIVTTGKVLVAPVITTQPSAQNVSLGDPVTFSVVATGGSDTGSELTYQWRKEGVDLPGATDSSYSIPSAMYEDAGNYSVVVTNTAGSTTSVDANLHVAPPAPPSITAHPGDLAIVAGESATFTVGGGGFGLSYQWQKSTDGGASFADVPGATSATYTIARAQTSHIGMYRAVVTNSTGSINSNAASLTLTYSSVGFTPNGYAAAATGGGNLAETVVTTASAFKTAAESTSAAVITVLGTIDLGGKVSVKSNKTIQGIDGEATVVGNIEIAAGVSNVVIRGLNVTNPAGSGISIAGANTVFITNVSFFDSSAPLLSITNGADNITVAWSEFFFSSTNIANRQATLIGNATGETKPLRVTLHHNWWSNGLVSHMPDTTYGHVHMYNNLFRSVDSTALGNTTGTLVLGNAQLFSERNQYTGITAPFNKNADLNGRLRNLGNVYTSSSGANAGEEIVFTPNYGYQLQTAASVAASVSTHAGNTAGAGSNPPEAAAGSVSITGSASSVPVGGSFTLTAVTTGLDVASLQWRRNNFDISGATSPTYTVSGASFATAGNFTVAATLASGETLVSVPFTVETTPDSSQVPSSESPGADGGGSPSLYFLGALGVLACLRRAFRS